MTEGEVAARAVQARPVVLRRRVERSSELSRTQREVWASQRLHPAAPLANMATTHRIRGPLDADRFVRAFDRVVAASDALRSVVVVEPGGTRIDVLASPPARTTVLDLPADDLESWATDRIAAPIDVTDVAYDSVLIRHGDEDWTWWLDLHHLVTDATSQAIVFAEVASAYEDPDHVIDVGSFVDRPSRPPGNGSASAARPSAAASSAPLRPFGVRGATTTSSPPSTVPVSTRALTERAHAAYPSISPELSLLAVLVSSLALAVHRLDGRSSFAVGVPVHHRRTRSERRIVGPLMELHPVEVTILDDDTASTLVGRTLTGLVEMLRSSAGGGAPQRDFELVVNVFRPGAVEIIGLEVEVDWVRAPHVDPAHPIRLHAFDYDQGLGVELDVNAAVAPGDSPQRLGEHVGLAIEALLAGPDMRIADVDLSTGADERDLAALIPPAPDTVLRPIHEVVADALRARPGWIVAEDRHGAVDAAEFDLRIRRAIAWLRAEGVVAGSRIGLRMERSVDVLVAIHAVLRSGAAFVMLDPSDPEPRHAAIVNDAAIRLIVDDLATSASFEADDPAPNDGLVGLDDIAYVLYTSGSTGMPKGVPISHRGLADYLGFAVDAYCDPAAPPTVALHSALVFDLTVTSLFLSFVSGGRVVVAEGDPVVALQRVAGDDRITFLKATPSQLELYVRMVDRSRPLTTVVVGGEAFRRPVAEAVAAVSEPGVAIFNEYGPTEAVVGCMVHRWDPTLDTGVDVPIGAASPGSELTVLDPCGHPTPAGAWGELWVRRLGMATGYLNRPELSAERFVLSPRRGAGVPGSLGGVERGPWYRTGDRVRLERPGVLTYGGRLDDQMKVNGVRLEPAEVEAALVEHPNVTNALVRLWTPATHSAPERCMRCGLGVDVPGVELDDDRVCSVCQSFDRVRQQTAAWFRTEDDLDAELAAARRRSTGDYDCLHLLSGGKDSSYALYQLVERGWRVHAFTLDNGFISEGAKENIRASIDALGITHEFATTDAMNDIFRDSLDRYSNVCQGCYKTIYTMAVARAEQLGIPVVVTGLSRGQFFETRLIPAQFESGRFDPEAIDAAVLAARKVYHRQPDAVTELLPEQAVFDDDAVFDRVEFLDFYRYVDVDLAELYRYLEDHAPWVRPADTGRSTNCLVNVAGIQVHHAERGYHNYAEPYAWDVRLGHKTRDEALAELDDRLDGGVEHPEVAPMLDEIGYRPKRIEVLTAWYQSSDGRDLDPDELRRWLRGRVGDRAVPAAFVRIDEVPLAASAKADPSALPAPTRRHRRSDELVLPSTEVERTLCAIWAEVLRLEAVGVTDDFFDLGGDSIAALEVVATVADFMGVELDDAAVFEARTIRELAAVVEHGVDGIAEHAIGRIEPLDSADGPGARPLSAGEEAMLFEYRRDPSDTRYNVTRLYTLPGDVDVDRLHAAIRDVVMRHEPLHTSFDATRRALDVDQAVHIETVEADSAEAFRHLVLDARREPFDLDRGPLVRVQSALIGDSVQLGIGLHHISVDAGTFDVFWTDVSRSSAGRPLAPIGVSYAAHGAWQRTESDSHREYWANERALATDAGPPATLGLAPPTVPEPDGYLSSRLPFSTAALRATTARTPFVAAVVAASAAVRRFASGPFPESRVSGVPVEIGVTASVKDHPDAAPLVGYFLNTLPVRIVVADDASFSGLAAIADGVVTDAVRHRTHPFASIVRDARSAGHLEPDVSIMLAYERLAPADFDGRPVSHEILASGTSVADATFFVQERGEDLTAGIEYSGAVLAAVDARRLLDTFAAVLGAGVDACDTPVAEVGAGESLSELDGGPLPDHGSTVLRDVVALAAAEPDATAVIDGAGTVLSRHELLARALATARSIDIAVATSTRPLVGVCIGRSADMVVAILAAQFAGAGYVPLDPSSPADRLATIADAVDLCAVVADAENEHRIPDVASVAVAGAASGVDDTIDDLVAAAQERLASIGSDDDAYVIFTSGSTGTPRPVTVSHANLAASTAARHVTYDSRPDRFLLTSSIGFDSSIVGLFWPLATGGTVVVPDDREVHDVDALLDIVERDGVTHLLMVPSLYRAVVRRGGSRLVGLRTAIVAGEACTSDVVEAHCTALPDVELYNEYGPTEASVWSSVQRLDVGSRRARVPIGTPIAGVTLRTADPSGRAVPLGVAGELWISGPTVTAGYLDDDKRTAEKFADADGRRWYRTGDLVRIPSVGERTLEFLGRIDDQLNVGGVRVEPGEIEAVLRKHPGVDDAVVVADPRGRARLIAHVTGAAVLDPDDIRRSLVGRLPPTLVPAVVVQHPSLPRTSHGKLDRVAAAALAVDGLEIRPIDGSSSHTGLVDDLVAVWRSALDREVTADTDYFEVGGDSLAAVEIVTAAEELVGERVTIGVLLDGRTPAGMAALIRPGGIAGGGAATKGASGGVRVVTMQTGTPTGPLVVLTPAWDDVFGYRALTDALPDHVRVIAASADDVATDQMVTTIDALSESFETELLIAEPGLLDRRITLLGWSTAGVVSYDLAGRLDARGAVIERVVMVDTFFPGAEQHLWSNRWWKYKSLATPAAFVGEVKTFTVRRSQAIARKLGTKLLRYAGVELPPTPERTSVGGVPLAAFGYRPEPSDVDIVLYAVDTTNPERTFRRWQEVADVDVVPVIGRHRGYRSIMDAERVRQITDDLALRLADRSTGV